MIVGVVQLAYPRHGLPADTFDYFVEEVATYPNADAAMLAVRELLRTRTGEFPPGLPEILRAIAETDTAAPTFGQAWAELTEVASTCDYFSSEAPRFSHVALDELARQLGWETFRMADPGDTYWMHAAEERYGAICRREVEDRIAGRPTLADRQPRALPGEARDLLADVIGETRPSTPPTGDGRVPEPLKEYHRRHLLRSDIQPGVPGAPRPRVQVEPDTPAELARKKRLAAEVAAEERKRLAAEDDEAPNEGRS